MATHTLTLRTDIREQMVDITADIERLARESGVADGIVTVFCPHTTAAITINENADPDVQRDVMTFLGTLIPRHADFRHAEGNADSHIKAILTGPSTQVILSHGRLMLGTWQAVYFCEFDGPRHREVWVQIGAVS